MCIRDREMCLRACNRSTPVNLAGGCHHPILRRAANSRRNDHDLPTRADAHRAPGSSCSSANGSRRSAW
eukprot:7361644-Alexandrium_andersonii.AAC.1